MSARESTQAFSARPLNPGWILLAGVALAAVGLAFEPQDPTPGTPLGPQNPSSGVGAGGTGLPAFATSDSNGTMIAVTGIDVTGSSLLYIVDTETHALSVYQATGGTSSMMNLRWVGARNIGLDLQVDGFNDRSEHSYQDLADKFRASGLSTAESGPGPRNLGGGGE